MISCPLLILILNSFARALTIATASSFLPSSHIHEIESRVLYRKCGLICACRALSSVLRSVVSSFLTSSMSLWILLTRCSNESDRLLTSTDPSIGSKTKSEALSSKSFIACASFFAGFVNRYENRELLTNVIRTTMMKISTEADIIALTRSLTVSSRYATPMIFQSQLSRVLTV